MLGEAHAYGVVVVSPIAYAEMLANPAVTEQYVKGYIEDTRIILDLELSSEVWEEAGRRFRKFSARRKQSGGGEERRLLADFVVGAHALLQANRLLTFDRGRYERDFPELELVGGTRQ
jgi:predicted nucleic acid-binding protein